MDDNRDQQIRDLLAAELFGVLALHADGRLHSATIHFAHTDDLVIVCAFDPASLKGRLVAAGDRATLQVDNRALATRQPERFTRLSIEGTLAPLPAAHPDHDDLRRAYVEKLAAGAQILAAPAIALYALRPARIRIAVGGAPPEDLTITYDEQEAPAPAPAAATADPTWAWATPARPPTDDVEDGAPDIGEPRHTGERD